MGYADANGNIAITPVYGCALPFEKGVAEVSMACKVVADGDEHWHWQSDNLLSNNVHFTQLPRQ